MKKNELVELEITGYTAQGSGVGRVDGAVVFVPCTARGDRIRAKIVKVDKRCAFGRVEQVLCPSPYRTSPDCESFPRCGGCVTRHLQYEEELFYKEQRVRDALERVGGFSVRSPGQGGSGIAVCPIVGADCVEGYRNKAQLPIGQDKDGIFTGYFAPRSHRIIPCTSCALSPKPFEAAVQAVREWASLSGETVYQEETGQGCLRHLYLRMAKATGQVMVCLVVNGDGVKQEEALVKLLAECVPGLASVVINSNRERTNVILGKKCRTVWGSDAIIDRLCGLDIALSPLAFYQVNREQAERLYELAGAYADLTGAQTVLDLYCGAGTIGLSMAKRARQILGVEIVEQAVEDARQNASRNGIQNAQFWCMDAAQAARLLKQRGESPDVIVLDPPRKGCAPELIETAAAMGPKRVVYVSCDPATLARDLARFDALGYQPQELTPVDLFPRTAHVECVVWMSRTDVGRLSS